MTSPALPDGPRSLRAAVQLLELILPDLYRDLADDIEAVVADLHASTGDQISLDRFSLDLKCSIQSLFGLIESTANAFTSAVLATGVSLSPSDRAILFGFEYDSNADTCLDTPRQHSLEKRAEAALRTFITACGGTVEQWSDEHVAHFKIVAKARNLFTHPIKLEYLSPVHAYDSFRHLAGWYSSLLRRELSFVPSDLQIPLKGIPGPLVDKLPPARFPDPSDTLNRDFYAHLESVPGAAIAYIDRFNRKLHSELQDVLFFCRSALTPPYDDRHIGRAVRRAIRTVATTAEGEAGFALFFMRAVRWRKSKIPIPSHPKGTPVPTRFAATIQAFSAALGIGFTPQTSGSAWSAFLEAFSVRDRLTHPRRPSDVQLSLKDLSTAMSALGWLSENGSRGLHIDEDKAMVLVGRR